MGSADGEWRIERVGWKACKRCRGKPGTSAAPPPKASFAITAILEVTGFTAKTLGCHHATAAGSRTVSSR